MKKYCLIFGLTAVMFGCVENHTIKLEQEITVKTRSVARENCVIQCIKNNIDLAKVDSQFLGGAAATSTDGGTALVNKISALCESSIKTCCLAAGNANRAFFTGSSVWDRLSDNCEPFSINKNDFDSKNMEKIKQ